MRLLRWLLAIALVTTAGLAWVFYAGQGIAIGALIGLPGRQADIAAMQHTAQVWLVTSMLSELAAVAIITSLLSLGVDATGPARFVARGIVGAVIAVSGTVGVVVCVFAAASVLRR